VYRPRLAGLWRHSDFLKLWAGQTISLFGSQFSLLAVPLAAAIALEATPAQMGILAAASQAPYLLLGLVAGVWVDRRPRRPIMVAAELGRALVIGSIPLAWLLGALTVEYLYVVTFVVGILAVFFDVAYQSFLPSLVDPERLIEGNSKLELSRSAAQITGPGLAGAVVQLVTAPVAILADAFSFLASALFLGLIRTRESPPTPPTRSRGLWGEIREGLGLVLGHPLLRAIAASNGISNLFDAVQLAVFILFVTRELGVSPGVLGLILATGNVGLLAGALLAESCTRRLGLGSTLLGAISLISVSRFLIPLAAGSTALAVPMLVGAQLLIGLGRMLFNINHLSLRQAITPHRLQGRVNASMRVIAWGMFPVGALVGGALGEMLGLEATLLIGAIGGCLAIGSVAFSPLRALRDQPSGAGWAVADEGDRGG
jgi:MFS family permease